MFSKKRLALSFSVSLISLLFISYANFRSTSSDLERIPPKIINRNNLDSAEWISKFVKKGCAPNCLNYPITVTSITRKDNYFATRLRVVARHIVRKINENFRLSNGNQIANFYLKDVKTRDSYYPLSSDDSCNDFYKMGNGRLENSEGIKNYSFNSWYIAFDKCTTIRDSKALNIYIYDSYNDDNDSSDEGGKGFANRNNNYRAFILLDYYRILEDMEGKNKQRPSAHEVGHALGLHHVCDANGVDIDSNTNLMASGGDIPMKNFYSVYLGNDSINYDCPYAGGNRTLGISSEQLIVALESIYKQTQYWLDPTYGAE